MASTVPSCIGCPGLQNAYQTPHASAPVAWIMATEGQVGWFTTDSLDEEFEF